MTGTAYTLESHLKEEGDANDNKVKNFEDKSIAFKYVKCKIGNKFNVVVRTQVDAYVKEGE